ASARSRSARVKLAMLPKVNPPIFRKLLRVIRSQYCCPRPRIVSICFLLHSRRATGLGRPRDEHRCQTPVIPDRGQPCHTWHPPRRVPPEISSGRIFIVGRPRSRVAGLTQRLVRRKTVVYLVKLLWVDNVSGGEMNLAEGIALLLALPLLA